MVYSLDFLPIMQVIGLLVSLSVLIFILNLKRDFNWVWMIFVVLPIYLLLLELPKGRVFDQFFNAPWTLPFAVIISLLSFLALGFKFPVKGQTIVLLAITFFILLGLHEGLWAHLIGVAFYLLFSITFIKLSITTLKHWFSDAP
ncbi:MAG: hypothetical protein IPJ89_04740 [Candidatus Iainarchaeum archaeon]|uniref:Uncharacterized protein n=1 Tax=Candidatus Iainarchaeum sp. TaxID=3101447 RepID=A0A7T9DJE6_9ARCH|nr:MAG: hypothetical protein IPJ89_04740 [Candidatus Diapherotrites archaeon]